MKQISRYEALLEAVRIAGSQQAFAELLGKSQPTVSRMINQSKQLPAEDVLRVEAATGVSRHLLRPDIYPRETPSLPAAAIGEETPLCGPILSARTLARHGNRRAILPGKDAA